MAMEWNDDQIALLRELWPTGLSSGGIGKRLGCSKNAVVGKAHRLDLPGRPSPIVRGAVGNGRIVMHAPRKTLAPLASEVEAVAEARAAAEKPAVAPAAPAVPAVRVAPEPEVKRVKHYVDARPLGTGRWAAHVTLPPLSAAEGPVAATSMLLSDPGPFAPVPAVRVTVRATGSGPAERPKRICEWLENNRAPWGRCAHEAVNGSWCPEHRKRVFVKRDDEDREEAA